MEQWRILCLSLACLLVCLKLVVGDISSSLMKIQSLEVVVTQVLPNLKVAYFPLLQGHRNPFFSIMTMHGLFCKWIDFDSAHSFCPCHEDLGG